MSDLEVSTAVTVFMQNNAPIIGSESQVAFALLTELMHHMIFTLGASKGYAMHMVHRKYGNIYPKGAIEDMASLAIHRGVDKREPATYIVSQPALLDA